MPRNHAIESVLILGSGPILIGQACEFDYAGSQAARALREEGITVSLINSNPATIMTDPVTADHIYLLPLAPSSVRKILEERKIDAVLPTMGGQTALNLCKACAEIGLWEEFGVQIIGVDIEAIDRTENREQFRQLMHDIGVAVPASAVAHSFLEGKDIAQKLGFPLVIRPSFTLGGTGGGFVHSKAELDELLLRGLKASPIHEVLVEKSIFGWKEFELELLRDDADNVIIICTIENMDPMGIHTGDSITVAPAMTLPDTVYQRMRSMAIRMMRAIGHFAGGCNVQFSLHPETEEICAIEINPRVSRSSALASKATGYPIAKMAAKLAIGYRLDELKNPITQTSAFFEPTLDYVIVKIPRWNFDKFPDANRQLGLQMKSVGEVMAIGRNFQEALQKACQSLDINRNGLGADGREVTDAAFLRKSLAQPSWNRLFHIYDAFKLGIAFHTIAEATAIDPWFLKQIQELVYFEKELQNYSIHSITPELMREAKEKGYGDRQLGRLLQCLESEVYRYREAHQIQRVYKQVDTCAAEFEAHTAYFYSTFADENESIPSSSPKVMILGSGPNRIGQGIEFDYACVHAVLAAKQLGYETILVNCNPETVSTDPDIADKLYFEPVFWEHLYDIISLEKPDGVLVQLGGQTALKWAEKLDRYGIPILGSSFNTLDLAEDRGRFSELLLSLNIPFPHFGTATSTDQAIEVARTIGFPLLVRPSYVLGGQKMKIVLNEEELQHHIIEIFKVLPGNTVLLDLFLDQTKEAEVDAICDGQEALILGVMEHIEPAGIHSGDSYAVLPPYSLSADIIAQMEDYTRQISLAMQVKGLINVQFAIRGTQVFVIEANPRASRTVPFICKAYGQPYIQWATQIMLGKKNLKDFHYQPQPNGYAIKIPVFSYDKFPDIQKELGPEMKSTGEAIHFIHSLQDPYFLQLLNERNLYLSR
jgi:carbamoyl-phosphate synthase large subunit